MAGAMTSSQLGYSVITPSRGDKPKALLNALQSVLASWQQTGLPESAVEMLVGFDGRKGERVLQHDAVRYYDFPADGDFGNAIRNGLIKAAKGRRLLFLDDDNALTLQAFSCYEQHADADMVLARIDTSRSLKVPYLPVEEADKDIMRLTNVDPLCVCVSREVVAVRCNGWRSDWGYSADFQNMHCYWRRAASKAVSQTVVGVYDAGLGLDSADLSPLQQMRLVRKADTAGE